MAGTSSLPLLADVAAQELAAQERRGDALDSKAGVLLGFAGVLVGLSVASQHGNVAHVGAGFAGLAALAAGGAFIPRSFPTLSLRALRASYLAAEEEFTRLRLLDTHIAMYYKTQGRLATKAILVMVATIALGVAVVLTVMASIL